ncbi:MAG: cobaltochelatase subunit CobN [Rubrivivax sp.]|nr:MAG: cobaltochelatase subunit CobN [Rubrivivax sp.]
MAKWIGWHCLSWLVMGWAVGVQAAPAMSAPATVLWLTTDVTPAPRTDMLERLARAQGLKLLHIEYPLRGGSALTAPEAATLGAALKSAAMVWIDAPHVTVQTRLERLLNEPLAAYQQQKRGRVAWVTADAAAAHADQPGLPRDPAARIAAYLQAAGEGNSQHALTLTKAVIQNQPLPDLPPPQPLPTRGLYHPDAPALFADAQALSQWQQSQAAWRDRPAVVLLVHRYHFVNGATQWIDDWLRLFASQGILAYAAFGQQVDAAGLSSLLEVPGPQGRTLHARVIVLHQLMPQGAAMQPLFARWAAPILLTQPYRSGDQAAWSQDEGGLAQSDVPFYLAQPEGAGAVDPVMVVAHADQGKRPELIERQAQAVVAKARRLIALQTKPVAAKQLVAMVYNYPPGGSNFGASFLNVPRSLEQVSGGLAQAGYTTHAVPEAQWIDGLKPLLAAYYPGSDLGALLASNQAAALPLADYEAWWATLPPKLRQRIEAQWGPPASSRYVVSYQGQRVFVIPRMQVGQLSVLPQPPREETLHLGQNPFMHRSKTPLSHHYLAVYLWARRADALIHFGTHGTQEWAPGKARSLDVWDDAFLPLGDVPVIYPYIVDNLGEALTAKRRGRAVLVSHKTPVFSPAGFEAKMAHMHELMHEWETVDAGPTRQALEHQLTANFVEHQLHRDLGWTAERIAADFSGFLELLHPYLDTLAQSSQPKGLAVFGRVPEAAQRHQTILQSLRKPLIDALGEDIDEAFLIDHQAVATARPSRWLDVALVDAKAASTLDLRPAQSNGFVPNRAARKPIDSPALFKLAERAQALEALLSTEGELPGLLTALSGHFIPAAYGGDPIRNPDSLPTGRNLTGLDPSRLPTHQAFEVAKTLFNDWLKTWRAEHGGQTPTRMALSLWAGETLRHQGIMEAQALVALGVEPVWDDSGRPTGVRVIPAATLQRPRVDVLLSITGSYRDQFPALMALVDQAVAAASKAEPDNAVANNTAVVAAELAKEGVLRAQAQTLARARVFGNVAGDYGTGLSEAVQSEGVQRDDSRLGEMFLQRMSQPYVDGQAVEGLAKGAAAKALGSHLRHTQAAVLSRTSHLYAMVTSDDPFQYLGGLAAAARSAGKTEALGLYVNQLQDSSEVHTQSAAKSIALEMQSRYLHPGWLQAQKAEGYAGTLQVLKALQFTWGWQVTAPDTVRPDHWQNFYEVLVQDKHKLGVPQWLRSHPQAYAQSLERLVQAQRMGYWQPDAATQQQVAQLYKDLTREAALPNELGAVRHWVAQQLNDPTPTEPAQPAPAPPLMKKPAQTAEHALPKPEPPQGLLLQRQPDSPPPESDLSQMLSRALAGVLMGLLVLGGASWQALRRPMPALTPA